MRIGKRWPSCTRTCAAAALRVDRLVRHDDDLVAGVGDFAGEVLQQVLGVVPDTGPARRQRGAVKRDAHDGAVE